MREPFEIVFNDEYLVVVNKIAKLLVHPSPKKEKYTLTSLLEEKLRERVFPCHRLDRQTSGLVLYARSKKLQALLSGQFRRKEVAKRYYALVRGAFKVRKGTLSGDILDREGQRFGEKPRSARTFFRVLAVYNDFSLLDLEPLTGRTNQLRIQLSEAGHPILGERVYALGKDFPVKFRRLALHAYYLRFRHPVSRDNVEVKIDMAEDMKDFINKARGYKSTSNKTGFSV